MGVCVSKGDLNVTSPEVSLPSTKQQIRPKLLQKLIEMKKTRNAPLLSLDKNPLFAKRIEAFKDMEETLSADVSK
jgi:hypothetical protein